ncbi:serine/threonine protein kinase [Aureliella helgolandensis]|uniref:Serine/threonine-protein kinase PrkC n=1 Tax=Aureliella helgolandensis TaxID=2527968 RepID=A0A518G3Y2_9BACT|nr:protein kinase [Aureliella helgolandensis]QDV23307.1 Serine/threonine-protein kinase PrkC [Aureliella helgolandensis]
MHLPSVELWQRITDAGLATAIECRQWAAQAAKVLKTAELSDGVRLAKELVEQSRLTAYQVEILFGDTPSALKRGDWIVRMPVDDPMWRNWFVAERSAKGLRSPTTPLTTTRWVRWLDERALLQLQSNGPSLKRLERQSQVRATHLQPIHGAEVDHGQLAIAVDPLTGKSLAVVGQGHRFTVAQSLEIVRQIAAALSALHQGEIVHGRVFPDRVYLAGKQCTLARDPLCEQTAGLAHGQREATLQGLIGTQLGDLRDCHFLAPEFLAPGQTATKSTDVYALGCLWWWLLTGQAVTPGESDSQCMAGHARPLRELPESIELPEPLRRCLRHALAKNPQARFEDATRFCTALDTAQQISVEDAQSAVQVASSGDAAVQTESSQEEVAARANEPINSPRTSPEPAPVSKKPSAPNNPQGKRNSLTSQSSKVSPKSSPKTFVAAAAKPAPLDAGAKSRTRSRKASNKWLIPTVGGALFAIVALLVLKFSGALEPNPDQPLAKRNNSDRSYVPPQNATSTAPPITLAAKGQETGITSYHVVPESEGRLWVPPSDPSKINLELLPPGGQLFLRFRPAEIMESAFQRKLLKAFDKEVSPWLDRLAQFSGRPLESIDAITIACYSPASLGNAPQYALRVDLKAATPLSELSERWGVTTRESIGDQELLLAPTTELAYYVAEQPLVQAASVSHFAVGPASLMREAVELAGTAAPLVSQLEKLWRSTNSSLDVNVLFAPTFLFSDGRTLLESFPARLEQLLRDQLSGDKRAAALQVQWQPQLYVEWQVIGQSDRDAGKISSKLAEEIQTLGSRVETWFVDEAPHPHWRALALRYPQMLQLVSRYTRVSVEDGVAIANLYLPSDASINLLLASWIALQQGATISEGATQVLSSPTVGSPFTVDQYLERPIRIRFDQEPIEVALQLVEEEANSGLPPGASPMRFVLDGDAFELAGITRNQQLRDFQFESISVRAALTEIAKRGNPATPGTDLRHPDQKLIWVATPDATSPGNTMVSLTTRAAAAAASQKIPQEFAAP